MANSTQETVNLAQGAPTVGVGQSLKAARELTGKSVDEVAEQLRIRQPFLQALEDGRHKDLPGGTYAVGFLRTYAEFLGLDGEEMVRRFRAEAAGELNARSELVFPSPVSEGRIPGGAVLFLGLMVAGIAYAGWYFLSSRNAEVAEMVPPLPDRLASALHRPPSAAGEAAKPAETAKPDDVQARPEDAAPTGAAAKDGEVVPPSEEDEARPAAPHASAPAAAVPAPEPAKPAVAIPKADPAKIEATPKPDAVKPAGMPSIPPAAAPAPAPAVPAAPAAATPPAQPQAAAAPAADGKVIGHENADSRIQLKAAADDCWVQVREMDGQLLLSRLLRRGDSYMVPNRPGLTLMVGNAGALEIMVDGRKGAPLGAAGQVRRDIKLDPDKLQAGG